MQNEFRPAHREEMDDIFRMGFDVWGRGKDLESYLRECRSSKKYARGRWYVLAADGALASSALVFDLPAWGDLVVRGIGSMATFPNRRGQGFAGELLERLMSLLSEGENASLIFLHSDIAPGFYEKRGFFQLAAGRQRHSGSVAMAWQKPELPNDILETNCERIPGYF